MSRKKRLAVFASGTGSNFEAKQWLWFAINLRLVS